MARDHVLQEVKLLFQEGEPEDWDYTLYVLQFGYWHNSKQDWTHDDDSMVTEVCVGIGHARTSQG